MKKLLPILALLLLFAACETDADVARQNLDTAAEQFEVERRIVFINGITDNYLLEVIGRCSYEAETDQVVLVCKTAENEFWKHSMVRSDNVTVVIEQLTSEAVSEFRHRVIFRPESIVPNVDLETSRSD